MSIESVILSNHIILCCPLLLLPSIFPSIKVFPNESVLHIRYPKYWNFSFSISPSSEHSALISSRTDWFDLLAIQGTLKSLLQQFKSISYLALILLYGLTFTHHFFVVLWYRTPGKTIALTIQNFVSKVMSLFFLIHCLGLS